MVDESTLSKWTGRASDTEQDRYNRTKDRINKAIEAYEPLSKWDFKVYPKGSYPNFTNVVRDSDVDIAVELTGLVNYSFDHGAKGLTMADIGRSSYQGDYGLAAFKDDVEQAMRQYFSSDAVRRGNKAIEIAPGPSGLPADVVPCQSHRQVIKPDGTFRQGIRLRDDSNPLKKLINYPVQHLQRGIEKNDRTQRRYKRVVRILKRLENQMVDEGLITPVASFMIESAVWSVTDAAFNDYSTWKS